MTPARIALRRAIGDGLQHAELHPRAVQRPGAAGEPAAAAARRGPRSVAAAEVPLRPGRRRARCSTASATRTATATATARRPTASRSCSCAARLPDSWYARGRHAVEEEHGRDRHPDGRRARAVRRAPEAEPRRPAADVQPGLPRARPVRLRDPVDAVGALAARHQPRALPLAEYDAAYEAFLRTPPGRSASRWRAGCPRSCKPHADDAADVRISNVFVHPWVKGYWPSPFGFAWKYLDVDPAKRSAAKK